MKAPSGPADDRDGEPALGITIFRCWWATTCCAQFPADDETDNSACCDPWNASATIAEGEVLQTDGGPEFWLTDEGI